MFTSGMELQKEPFEDYTTMASNDDMRLQPKSAKTSHANAQTNPGNKHKAPDHNHEAMMDLSTKALRYCDSISLTPVVLWFSSCFSQSIKTQDQLCQKVTQDQAAHDR